MIRIPYLISTLSNRFRANLGKIPVLSQRIHGLHSLGGESLRSKEVHLSNAFGTHEISGRTMGFKAISDDAEVMPSSSSLSTLFLLPILNTVAFAFRDWLSIALSVA